MMKDNILKLIDFGLCIEKKNINQFFNLKAGTLNYMAPE